MSRWGVIVGLSALLLGASEEAPAAWPDRIPAMEVRSGDGHLRLLFMGQLRFVFDDADVGGGPAGEDKLKLQRIRPVLKGTFFDDKLGFKLHLNTGPTTIELLDFFVDYRLAPSLRLRVGQQKIPFTRYRLNSFARLTLVDWSPAARAFGAERQIGLQADGHLGAGFVYAAGVFSGVNARAGFERGLAQAYGQSVPNPSRLDDPAPPARVHPELALRLGWQHGEDRFDSASDATGGPLRLLAGLSLAWDLRPEVGRDFALRVAPEVLVKVQGLSAGFVGYLGAFEAHDGGGFELGMLGLTLQAAYRFFDHYEVSLRYARTQVLEALRADARAWAASRSDPHEVPGVAHRQEVALGVNVYIIGNALEWQTDVALRYAGSDGQPGLQVRSQLQLMF